MRLKPHSTESQLDNKNHCPVVKFSCAKYKMDQTTELMLHHFNALLFYKVHI